MCAGESGGSSPNDSDLDAILLDGPAKNLFQLVQINHAFNAVTLTHESLQSANRDRLIEFASPARRLAGSSANTAADRSKRIRTSCNMIRFLVSTLLDQRDISPCLCVQRACGHTREIRV